MSRISLQSTELPFEKQIAYFAKKTNLPSRDYAQMKSQMHDYAFVVAGADTAEMVADFRSAVDRAINDGVDFREFKKDFIAMAAKHNFTTANHRAKLIYNTNLYASYNYGRYEQQRSLIDILPYWQYEHNDNANPRLHHMALDGAVHRADSDWWAYHYPPRGYNCHCTVKALDDGDIERQGLTVTEPPPIEWEDVTVGVRTAHPYTMRVPKGVDPSFARPLGRVPVDHVDKMLMQKLTDMPPSFASNVVSRVLDYAPVLAMLNQSVARMVDDVVRTMQKRGEFKYVGVLSQPTIAQLEIRNLAPQSAIIAVRDEDILHALRDHKRNNSIALDREFWRELPTLLQDPDMIVLQTDRQGKKNLLYVFQTKQGKVAIRMDYEMKVRDVVTKKKTAMKVNLVRTGSVVKDFHLEKSDELLWKKETLDD